VCKFGWLLVGYERTEKNQTRFHHDHTTGQGKVNTQERKNQLHKEFAFVCQCQPEKNLNQEYKEKDFGCAYEKRIIRRKNMFGILAMMMIWLKKKAERNICIKETGAAGWLLAGNCW
jgi:hypothetical protein